MKKVEFKGIKKHFDNREMFSWEVIINGESFDYYTGLGHGVRIKPFRAPKSFDKTREHIRTKDWFVYVPQIDDILECLFLDTQACETSFDSWCADFGYDTDSRKALETYLACQANSQKLMKALKSDFWKEKARIEARND